MKNIKSALALAFLIAAPALYAQDTKAPAEPGFNVTLTVTANAGGLDSLYQLKDDGKDDKLILSGAAQKSVLSGTTTKMYLKANAGYKLGSFIVNEASQTLNANFKTGRYGTAAVNGYIYAPTEAITGKTTIAITWVEKPGMNLTYKNTHNTTGSAAALVVYEEGNDVSTLVKGYYKKPTHLDADKVAFKKEMPAGTYYVWLKADETAETKALDIVVPYSVNNKAVVTVETAPTCADELQEGQSLSAAKLTGGVCKDGQTIIKGTWTWANPNQELKVKADITYTALFTPDQSGLYNTATAEVSVATLKVATVTVEQTTGGTVKIENATPDNRYVGTANEYSDIKVIATPALGYKFVKWLTPANTVGTNSETPVSYEFAPGKDLTVVKAEFAKASRTVKLGTADGGTVEVYNGKDLLGFSQNSAIVDYGTALTIVAKPTGDNETTLISYKVASNKAVNSTYFVVGGEVGTEYTVAATFAAKTPANKMVTVTAPINGSITMLDAEGAVVNPNSSVKAGSTVTVIAIPNKGYKLGTLVAGDKDINAAGSAVINVDTDIRATFVEEEYAVVLSAPAQVEIAGIAAGNAKYNTEYKSVTARIKAASAGQYKLVSLLVNNRVATNGEKLTIDGRTVISAQVQALTPVAILNPAKTTFVYDGSSPAYSVKTAAGLGGFDVSFLNEKNEKVTPTAVGTYKVHITRPYDELYAAYDNKTSYTLEILPGVPGITKIPTLEGLKTGEATVAGEWTTTKPSGRVPATLRSTKAAATGTTIYFVPSDPNIGYVTATTVADDAEAAKAKAVTITTDPAAKGVVALLNGTIPVTNGEAFANLTFTISATPNSGYAVDWSKITVNGSAVATNHQVTATDNITIEVAKDAFKPLTAAKTPKDVKNAVEYGLALPAVAGLDARAIWAVVYGKQDANTPTKIMYKTAAPKEVGTYTIYASCEEGTDYAAVADAPVGTLTISKAKLQNAAVVAKPIATPIVKGADLSTSVLTDGEVKWNGSVVAGTFKWETNAIGVVRAEDHKVVFTPDDDTNFDATSILTTSYVSLLGVQSYTMTVSNAADVVVKDALNRVVASGTKVPAGMKLTITPVEKAIESLSFSTTGVANGAEGVSGSASVWYCIAPASNFTMTVNLKEGEPEPTPGKHKVYFSITGNGTLAVMVGTTPVKNGDAVDEDAELTITATPAVGNKLTTLTYNGVAIASGAKKLVKEATTIAVVFTEEPDKPTGLDGVDSDASAFYGVKGGLKVKTVEVAQLRIATIGGSIVKMEKVNGEIVIPLSAGMYVVTLGNESRIVVIR